MKPAASCNASPRIFWRRQAQQKQGKRKQALLFLKKKKQKDLFMLGHGRWRDNAHGPDSKKFLRRFFQKAASYFIE
jgi:hypothetical protein